MQPQFLALSKAAQMVPCSESTLRNYADTGVVTVVRDSNGRRLFTAEDVETVRKHREQVRVRRFSK